MAKEEALLHSAITSSSRNGKKGSKAKKGGGKEGRKVSAATAERQGILLSPLSSLAPSLLSAHVNATLLHPAWHIEGMPGLPQASPHTPPPSCSSSASLWSWPHGDSVQLSSHPPHSL